MLSAFPDKYTIQAEGRDINLFYMEGESRDRIIKNNQGYAVANRKFTEQELLQILKEYPERFSPNVILRPLFQEKLLPDVAFIGGGAEIGYWLELKNLFLSAGISMPVLVLRNSFMLLRKEQVERIKKLSFTPETLFRPFNELLRQLVEQQSNSGLKLEKESDQLRVVYNTIRERALAVDSSLNKHVQHLQQAALNRLSALEKKMYKSEKKKFEASGRQLRKLRDQLFPLNGLQERHDNFLVYYSLWGSSFLDNILDHSNSLTQEFCILSET